MDVCNDAFSLIRTIQEEQKYRWGATSQPVLARVGRDLGQLADVATDPTLKSQLVLFASQAQAVHDDATLHAVTDGMVPLLDRCVTLEAESDLQ